MGGREVHTDLFERLRSASRRVLVLYGPAGSLKTTAALDMYRHFLGADAGARCLLVAPNAPAAAHLRRRLLRESPNGVIVAPRVITFSHLASRLLAAAGDESRAASPFERRLLLRKIIDDLHAAGRLSALAGVVDTPGIAPALDRAIAELKRSAIQPDKLRRAIGESRGKARDLLEVYTRYQRHLQENGLHDVEGRMWLARDRLAAAGTQEAPPGLEGIEAVAVDGFTDFTPTQLEMLELLSRRLRKVLITLPWARDARERMWHWTKRTLDNIRRTFGAELEEIDTAGAGLQGARSGEEDNDTSGRASGGEGPRIALRVLWDRVFDTDARPGQPPAGLHVLAACGTDAEVAAVARRIKRLLLGGAAEGGIAVLARSMEPYRRAIERIFAEHDIPVASPPQPLTDVPIIRFVLDAASLGPSFPFRGVLRVVKNSYFRPQALGDYDAGTVATAEMLIREGNVLEGRNAYRDAGARLSARAARTARDEEEPFMLGPIESSPDAIRAAAAMLERLFDLVTRTCPDQAGREAAPGGGSVGGNDARAEDASGAGPRKALSGLLGLVEALELRSVARGHQDPAIVARDLRALAAMEDALRGLREAPPLKHLQEALSCVTCPAARGESLVDVMDVLDARAIRYDHVFLLGVNEGLWPRKFVEGSLLTEADRLAWAQRGAVLDRRSDLAAREMLLFYLGLSRANAELTLCYQESSASGAPMAGSAFLLALLDGLGGLQAVDLERIAMGQFLPKAEELVCGRDAFNAALGGIFAPQAAPSGAGALAWAAANHPQKISHAAMGLWARHRRWRRGRCDAFDGRISDKGLLESLGRAYPAQVVFSASGLNTYGQCPWQYFATYVLKLQPLSEPQRRLEAVTRGRFVHNVLFRVMTRLREDCGGPVRLPHIDQPRLEAALEQAVAEESADVELRRPPYPALWQIQRRQMLAELRDYLLACRARDELQGGHLHFELGFGADLEDKDRLDPASIAGPVTVPTPEGDVRLRGKIDRVDRIRFQDRQGLLVIDYKTGRLGSEGDILAGRSLQLPLYAVAAEAILGEACLGGAFHRIGGPEGNRERYFAALKCGRDGHYQEAQGYDQQRQAVMEKVGQFIRGMRSGHFDLMPTHDCPAYCPFRRICHYSDARMEVKAPAAEEEARP